MVFWWKIWLKLKILNQVLKSFSTLLGFSFSLSFSLFLPFPPFFLQEMSKVALYMPLRWPHVYLWLPDPGGSCLVCTVVSCTETSIAFKPRRARNCVIPIWKSHFKSFTMVPNLTSRRRRKVGNQPPMYTTQSHIFLFALRYLKVQCGLQVIVLDFIIFTLTSLTYCGLTLLTSCHC